MHARLSRYAGLPPERIAETVREFEEVSLPVLEQQSGFKGILVGVDRAAGKVAALSYWESSDDLKRTEKMAEEMRAKAEATAEAQREPIVDHYEVVLQR